MTTIRPANAAEEEGADTLLSNLTTYLESTGHLPTAHGPEATVVWTAIDDHAEADTEAREEQQRITQLEGSIAALFHDQGIFRAANARLDAEHATLPTKGRMFGFEALPLADKLVAIKQTPARMAMEQVSSVSFTLVTSIDMDGSPINLRTCWLPLATSWYKFHDVLRLFSCVWQKKRAGYDDGYSLVDGGWTYSLTGTGELFEKALGGRHYNLKSADDYEIFKGIRSAQGVTGAEIWHVITREASEVRKMSAERQGWSGRDGRPREPYRLLAMAPVQGLDSGSSNSGLPWGAPILEEK